MAVHWLTLLLIAGVYGAVWASHAVTGREQSAMLVQLPRSMGLTILALTLFRLAWRWNARTPLFRLTCRTFRNWRRGSPSMLYMYCCFFSSSSVF